MKAELDIHSSWAKRIMRVNELAKHLSSSLFLVIACISSETTYGHTRLAQAQSRTTSPCAHRNCRVYFGADRTRFLPHPVVLPLLKFRARKACLRFGIHAWRQGNFAMEQYSLLKRYIFLGQVDIPSELLASQNLMAKSRRLTSKLRRFRVWLAGDC